DAFRIPGGHRHGDSQGSAAPPGRHHARRHPPAGRSPGSDNDRGARSGDEMDLGLKGKIAMVGGASKGLGFAVARALAAEGALVCIAARDADAIKRAARAIHLEPGVEALAVAADLSTAEATAAWHAATVKQFGGVD